jgi:hypothetical protein
MKPPHTPDAPDGDRDHRLAALLEVAPLDDVTRTRLVRTAMEQGGAAHRRALPGRAFAAVAAAVVALVAVGAAVVVAQSDEAATPRASAPAKRSLEGTTEAPAAAADERAPAGAGVQELAQLGTLGEVSSEQALRAAVRRAAKAPARYAAATGPQCAFEAALPLGRVIAVGTGTFHGEPATVIAVERPSGRRVALALVDATCMPGPAVRYG